MLKRKRNTSAAKKAKKYRKRYKKESLSSLYNNRIQFVRIHTDFFSLNVASLTGVGGGYTFQLSQVPGSSDFTSMYDQYKICGVHLKFFPEQTQTATLATLDSVRGNARFLTCIDLNDDTPPTTADDVRQYESCQVTSILEQHEVYIKKPLFLNSSGQNVSDWVSSQSPSVRWYGCKFFCEAPLNTGAGVFDFRVEAIFYLCFKNIK